MKLWLTAIAACVLMVGCTAPESDETATTGHEGHDHADHEGHDHGDPMSDMIKAELASEMPDAGVLDLAGLDYDQLIEQGELLIQQEGYQDAGAFFQAATDRDSTRVQAWYGLGYCYAALTAFDLGLFSFEKACEIDPTYRLAQSNKGYCKIRLGARAQEEVDEAKVKEGMADIDIAIAQNPNCGECYTNRAYGWSALNNQENTCADLEKALELGDSNAQAQLDRLCADTATE